MGSSSFSVSCDSSDILPSLKSARVANRRQRCATKGRKSLDGRRRKISSISGWSVIVRKVSRDRIFAVLAFIRALDVNYET